MTEVKQTIIGDSVSAQKAYADLARQVAKLEVANQQMTAKADQGTNRSSQGTKMLSGLLLRQMSIIGSTAGAVLSLGNAWQAAKTAAEEYMTTSDRIRQAKIDIARSETTLALNTLTPEQFKQASADVHQIAKETGFSNVAMLNEAMATAVNAAPDRETAFRAVKMGASLTKHQPELLDSFVGGSLDVSNSAGATAEEAMGLNLTAGKFARISNPERQQRAISQSVSSVVASSRVETPEERKKAAESGAEFWAALNKASKDSLGERSRTATEQFAAHANEAFTQGISYTPRGRSRPITIKPTEDPGDIVGRLEYLQQDARFGKAFMEKYSFESGYKDRFQQAIRDPEHSEFAANLKQAKGAVGYDDTIYGSATATIEHGSKNLEAAGRDQAAETRDITTKLEGLDQRALAAEARKIRNKALETTEGYGFRGGFAVEKVLGGTSRNFDDLFGTDADSAARSVGVLEEKRRGIRRGAITREGDRGRAFGNPVGTPEAPSSADRIRTFRPYTTEEQEADKTLRDAINALKPILEQQRDLAKRNLEETQARRPSAAGAARAEAGKGRER